MRIGGRDLDAIIERALYNREVYLEWAHITPVPEAAAAMRQIAEDWERFALNIQRDAAAIAESRRLLAQVDELLARK